jgi:CRISPR-associated protein Cas5h
MPFKNVLIFDVESEYGHFRKFNTTTSPLTYSIPTRPAVIGLVGAVLGIEREVANGTVAKGKKSLSELFSKANASVAVQLLNPVKKVNIGFNLLDTEKTASSFFNVKQRTQIEFELLKHPRFRIFISCVDEVIQEKLTEALKHGKSHFSPYLGLSQFTAVLTFTGTCSLEKIDSSDFIPVSTAINISNTEHEFDFEHNAAFKYTSDTMPIELSPERIAKDYSEVLIEATGREVKVKTREAFKAGDYGNILFL